MKKIPDPTETPLSDDDLRRMKQTPQAKIIRCAEMLSQETVVAMQDARTGKTRTVDDVEALFQELNTED